MDITTRPAIAAVYGGGGIFGIGYGLGVVDGLRDAGLDLTDAPALGTSAGTWVAASTALGVGVEALRGLEPPRVPDLRPGVLAGRARELYGDARHTNVTGVATVLPTGAKRFLRGDRMDLADICAASSAVPGVFAPHRVAGGIHLDGGVRSIASVDAAPAADLLVVVAPVGGPLLGPAGRFGEVQLKRELSSWRRRHGGALLVIRPNREIARLAGANPMSLFDKDTALEVYERARVQGRERAHLQRPARAAA